MGRTYPRCDAGTGLVVRRPEPIGSREAAPIFSVRTDGSGRERRAPDSRPDLSASAYFVSVPSPDALP